MYQNCIQYQIKDEYSYDAYFKKIHDKLPANSKTIYFSPDGIYNKLNINTLFAPTQKQYLLDLHLMGGLQAWLESLPGFQVFYIHLERKK